MFNVKAFNAMLAKHGKTRESVAELLGINSATLYRKINGISDFTRQEIQTIRYAFRLNGEELDNIFFAQESA